jgi:cyclopropane fatty-acyl-phospholipid synthase-like methyltransferase
MEHLDAAAVIRNQAEHHFLMQTGEFSNLEELCLHLRHVKGYEIAAAVAKGKRVLDLGCNNAYGTALLGRYSRQVVGVDVSPSALQDARRRFDHPPLQLVRIDGVALPFPAHSFDVIVSFQVIEHIADYAAYLSEMRRVLTADGIALLTTPNAKLRLDAGQSPWNEFHVHEFCGEELSRLLAQWFPNVCVGGLTAQASMYDVERARLARIRTNAERIDRAVRWRAATVRALRRTLPAWFVRLLARADNLVENTVQSVKPPPPPASLDPVVAAQHSTAEFFVDTRNVDSAIDLVAVCSPQRDTSELQQFL